MDPSLCINGCGFYSSAANNNLCSKCYNDYLKEIFTKSDDGIRLKSETKNLKGEIFAHELSSTSQKPCAFESFTIDVGAAIDAVVDTIVSTSVKKKNRCKSCNNKVGLTGFECRCGDLFCGRHRYPEVHTCKVDSKEIGRQALTKQNPLCIHDKLEHRI